MLLSIHFYIIEQVCLECVSFKEKFSISIDVSLSWLGCLGSFYLYAVFPPLVIHIYTSGVAVSQVYSPYPFDLGGSCRLYEVYPFPESEKVDKSFLSHCPGDSSISFALLLHATFCLYSEVPQILSVKCTHVLCGGVIYSSLDYVSVQCATEQLQGGVSPSLSPCMEELLW